MGPLCAGLPEPFADEEGGQDAGGIGQEIGDLHAASRDKALVEFIEQAVDDPRECSRQQGVVGQEGRGGASQGAAEDSPEEQVGEEVCQEGRGAETRESLSGLIRDPVEGRGGGEWPEPIRQEEFTIECGVPAHGACLSYSGDGGKKRPFP